MGTISIDNLQKKVSDLESRLAEAEQLIEAIKAGEVDAFAVLNDDTHEVFTLQTGDYAYRLLVEKFHEGALNLSEDGMIVYTNTYFHNFLGLPYEKLVGTYIFDYIAEDSKHKFNSLFTHALYGSSKSEINLEVNNLKIPVYVSLTSLQPHLATIGMIITDLTEKKKDEMIITGYQSELVEKNRLLSNKNKHLEQQILSEFSENFSEYKTGKDFFDSLTQSLAEKSQLDYAFIGDLVQTGVDEYAIKTISLTAFGNLSGNIQFPLKDSPCEQIVLGSLYSFPERCREVFPKDQTLIEFNVEGYIGYSLCDTNKQLIGLIAVMNRDKIEDIAYTESLLKIAAKRTELEMERLRNEKILAATNIELQNQNAELASFSYIASHDLQEPLRKIQALTSRIQDKENNNLSESGKDYYTRINDSAARMQHLIEALLAYSRTNTIDLVLEPTDLNQVLVDVKSDLQDEIRVHKVKIESDQLPVLDIMPLQFHQLFSNIIGNAIKYRKTDTPLHIKITNSIVPVTSIKTDWPLTRSNYWKISFEDNGIGFEPQYESKIFELFQRLHAKNEYEGTGIGLAICKKIMQNHKGCITATGKPGVGAIFSIYLPVEN